MYDNLISNGNHIIPSKYTQLVYLSLLSCILCLDGLKLAGLKMPSICRYEFARSKEECMLDNDQSTIKVSKIKEDTILE